MDNEKRRQDQELAAFTDALLEGQLDRLEKSDRPPLANTVETLGRVLSPQPPPASLRRSLKRQIATEWTRQRPSLFQRLTQPFGPSARRWAWAPVAALVLVAIAVALLVPAGGTKVTGTATGDVGTVVPVILAVLAGGLVIAWLVIKRKT